MALLKNKIIIGGVSLMIGVALSVPALAATTPQFSHNTFPAWKVKNLPQTATPNNPLGSTATAKKVMVSTNITVASDSLVGNSLQFQGDTTSANGKLIPFTLSGTLSKGYRRGTIYGTMKDSTGNYVVRRFEIVTNPSRHVFYSSAARTSTTSPYIAIYLQKSGTRKFVFMEAPAARVLGTTVLSAIQSRSENYSIAPAKDQLWVETMFHHGVIKKKIKQNPTVLPTRIKPTIHLTTLRSTIMKPSVNSTIQPMTLTTDPLLSATVSYYDYYYIFGYDTEDVMYLLETTTEPNGMGYTINPTLQVQKFTWSEYYLNGQPITSLTNKQTGWEVGGGGNGSTRNVGISLYTPSPLATSSVLGSASWEHASGFGVRLGIGFNAYVFESSLTWPLYQAITTDGSQLSMTLSNTQNSQDTGWYMKADSYNYLQLVGQQVDAQFEYDLPASTSSTSVTVRVDFRYDMYNSLDGSGYNAGMQDNTYSWSINPQLQP